MIGMLSHSNFGTDTEPLAVKIAKAVEILHFQYPDLLVDGEMKADIALNKQARNEFYPFNKLGDREINLIPEVASTRAIRNLSVIAAAETIPSK